MYIFIQITKKASFIIRNSNYLHIYVNPKTSPFNSRNPDFVRYFLKIPAQPEQTIVLEDDI